MNNYRHDIDGLRAIAVISILIFHVNKDWLPGGFIGVDVFFVISGYLITSIIYPAMQNNRFSLIDFYNRRIKRILPAVWFYTLLTLLVAFFVYLPKDLLVVAKSALATTFFLSNVYFTRNVDYFSPQAEENPLLHTWSLAVEEQFYVVWPLLLLGLLRFTLQQRSILFTLLLLGLISFASTTWLAASPQYNKWAFYLMPFRFGELLIGGYLAILNITGKGWTEKTQNAMAIAGSLLLVAGFAILDEHSLFPGLSALFPCLGTALLIASCQRNKVINGILTHNIMTHIGKISFSLYLAHWPVLAIMRYIYQAYELDWAQIGAALILTFLLAETTYRLIETPFRKCQWQFRNILPGYVIGPAFAVITICVVFLHSQGLPQRFDVPANGFIVSDSEKCTDRITHDCYIGDRNSPQGATILVGDSHGAFYTSLFDQLGKIHHFSLEARTVSGCVGAFTPLQLDNSIAMLQQCNALKRAFKSKQEEADIIFLAERWEARLFKENGYLEALKETLTALNNQTKTVILLAQVPKYECDILRDYLVSRRFSTTHFCDPTIMSDKVARANHTLKLLADQFRHVSLLSLDEFLCPGDRCTAMVGNDFLYADDDHLSLYGTGILANKLTTKTPEPWSLLLDRLSRDSVVD